MKKTSYLFGLFMFAIMIPKVYAFTYTLETDISNSEVIAGTEMEIKVSLKNIEGTSDGVASCSLNIEFDNNILLNSKVRSLGSWTLTSGKVYLLDTGEFVFNNSELLVIPVKVNGNGSVKLVNIECSDGNVISKTTDKNISFKILDNINNNDDGNTTNQIVEKSSNCDLHNIVLSEGIIDFNSDVTEYYLEVFDYDNLVVEPVLEDNKSTYEVEKTENNQIIITVMAEDNSSKQYTLHIQEINSSEEEILDEKESKSYVTVFIVIICVLVLINIVRIVVNSRNKNSN